MEKKNSVADESQFDRKSYTPPAIVLELELETRAGSPLGLPDDLLDLGE